MFDVKEWSFEKIEKRSKINKELTLIFLFFFTDNPRFYKSVSNTLSYFLMKCSFVYYVRNSELFWLLLK